MYFFKYSTMDSKGPITRLMPFVLMIFLIGGVFADWPVYRHDTNRTGYTTEPAPDANLVQKWNFTGIGAGNEPIVKDGVVYLASRVAILFALDEENGSEICVSASEMVNCTLLFDASHYGNTTRSNNICWYFDSLPDGTYDPIRAFCEDQFAQRSETTEAWLTVEYAEPSISIVQLLPASDFSVAQNKSFHMRYKLTCHNTNCGDVDVYLDPPCTDVDSSAYCANPGGDTSYDEYIDRLVFAGIDHTSDVNDYLDATDQITDPLSSGGIYTISIYESLSGYEECFTAWFDWNQDGVFDDGPLSDETYYLGCGVDTVISADIEVPATATSGSTMFRIIGEYEAYPPGPCTAPDYNEVEDYTVCVGEPAKVGLVSTTEGDKPFYTIDSNPTTATLSNGQSAIIDFWVNATGGKDSTTEFFAYADGSYSLYDETDTINVTITNLSGCYCGNGICDCGEVHETCPSDCVDGGSSSGDCDDSWDCGPWGPCINGTQTRECDCDCADPSDCGAHKTTQKSCECGANLDCNDENTCTQDTCLNYNCKHYKLKNMPCNDSDNCTVDDICKNGVCVGENICRSPDRDNGGGAYACEKYWDCSEWGECLDSTQQRTCTCACADNDCRGDSALIRRCFEDGDDQSRDKIATSPKQEETGTDVGSGVDRESSITAVETIRNITPPIVLVLLAVVFLIFWKRRQPPKSGV